MAKTKKLENTNRYQTTGTPTHFSWWCTNYLENSVSTQLNVFLWHRFPLLSPYSYKILTYFLAKTMCYNIHRSTIYVNQKLETS